MANSNSCSISCNSRIQNDYVNWYQLNVNVTQSLLISKTSANGSKNYIRIHMTIHMDAIKMWFTK
jgi:hypothetical protein